MKKKMVKLAVMTMAVLMVGSVASTAFAQESYLQPDVQSVIVTEIANAGALEVGYGDQVDSYGPQSFTVMPNGDVYIADTYNERIVSFSEEGDIKQVYAPNLGEENSIVDLVSSDLDDILYVLAINNSNYDSDIIALDTNTKRMLQEFSLDNVGGVPATSIQLNENGEVSIEYIDGEKIDINPDLVNKDVRNMRPGVNDSNIKAMLGKDGFIFRNSNNICYQMTYTPESMPVCNEFLRTLGDIDYYYISELNFSDMGNWYNRKVVAIDSDGNIQQSSLADMELYAPNKHLEVSENGTIYQMVVDKEYTRIYSLPLSTVNDNLQSISEETIVPFQEYFEQTNSFEILPNEAAKSNLVTRATGTITDPQTLASRASSIINYGWYYDSSKNNTNPDTSNVVKPSYLPSSSGYVTGLPYCWGAANAPKTISPFSGDQTKELMIRFDTAMDRNYFAGNVGAATSYISRTAGMDCSGFVCVVFNVWTNLSGRYSVKQLVEDGGPFKKVSSTFKPMDLYVNDSGNGNHVLIISDIVYSAGHGYMSTYESAKTQGKTVSLVRDLNTFGSGYSVATLR